MQRRAFELQLACPDAQEAPDPLEQHPEVLERLAVRTLTAAGEYDMPDFIEGAQQLARTLPDAQLRDDRRGRSPRAARSTRAFERLLREFLGGADG